MRDLEEIRSVGKSPSIGKLWKRELSPEVKDAFEKARAHLRKEEKKVDLASDNQQSR